MRATLALLTLASALCCAVQAAAIPLQEAPLRASQRVLVDSATSARARAVATGLPAPEAPPGGDDLFAGARDEGPVLPRAMAAETTPTPAPEITVGDAPVIEQPGDRLQPTSVLTVLRSLVTPTGAAPAGRPASAHRRARASGGSQDPVTQLFQPLALELIDASITPTGRRDGKIVFAVFGQGDFVLEAARDGSNLTLSELGTGLSMEVNTGDAGPRRPEPTTQYRDTTTAVGDWPVAQPHPSSADAVVGFFVGVVHRVVRGFQWLGDAPGAWVLLVPLAILLLLVDETRSAHPPPVARTLRAPGSPELDATRRKRRRKRVRLRRRARRRSSWRLLIGQLREALGFAPSRAVRESDFKSRRRRYRRRENGHA